eukprot:4127876-Pyramimonas_sp.AAC.1
MVLETLAQNRVSDNSEIAESLQKVLSTDVEFAFMASARSWLKAVLDRFDRTKPRAGSTYTRRLVKAQSKAR